MIPKLFSGPSSFLFQVWHFIIILGIIIFPLWLCFSQWCSKFMWQQPTKEYILPCSLMKGNIYTVFHWVFFFFFSLKSLLLLGVTVVEQWVKNETSIHEDSRSITSPTQWVKDPIVLWLWHRPAAAAPIWPLAWELPYASSVALKS